MQPALKARPYLALERSFVQDVTFLSPELPVPLSRRHTKLSSQCCGEDDLSDICKSNGGTGDPASASKKRRIQ